MAGRNKKTTQDGALNLSVLRNSLGFYIHMLDLHMMRWLGERCARYGLTPASASVLMVIRSNPGISHGKLADALLIQRPNMTKLMRRLESRGLLRRLGLPGDRRRVVLALTPKGKKVIASVSEHFHSQDRIVRQALDSRDDEKLLDFVRRMRDALTLDDRPPAPAAAKRRPRAKSPAKPN
jgi:DNA-binding MarR family transcriptional regulator